jgi:transposase
VNRLIERCAMLDIHKSQITACVRVPDDAGGRRQEIREFATTTSGLLTLADWLRSWSVTVVGMESTGVYWRPVFYLLEDEFECRLYNARHLRHVPGRKSDVQDAEWGCQLVEHGLVRSSFVPERPLRELRDLVRYRKAKIQERTREVQRVEKTLQDAGIKLSSVASEVLGVSARRMLEALISGTHDPDVLAELAKGALRKKIPALREALQGRFSGHHALLIGQMLGQIDFLDETIATLSERIEELTRPFSRELELLDTIPGVDRRAAELLLSEIGPDMSRFPTDAHLTSWGGICPGQRESGAKKHSAATRKGSKWLRGTLTESAKAVVRTKGTYLSARYHRIKSRRGHAKATIRNRPQDPHRRLPRPQPRRPLPRTRRGVLLPPRQRADRTLPPPADPPTRTPRPQGHPRTPRGSRLTLTRCSPTPNEGGCRTRSANPPRPYFRFSCS